MEEVSHSRRAVIAGAGAFTLRAALGDLTSAQCSEVEVFPGYPGFRSYVTGVDGFGDVASLAELEASDPGFDRDDVDWLNQAAANRLGIAGQPTDWTWENWMAIEAERGFALTCYSCAIEDGAVRGEPSQSIIPPNDPRLALGTPASTSALVRAGWRSGDLLHTDHDLRALTGMLAPGYWNAPPLLEGFSMVVTRIEHGDWFDAQRLLQNLVRQGGYAPTPPTAALNDQIFMIMSAMPVITRLLNPWAARSLTYARQGLPGSWRDQVRHSPDTMPPFADYFAAAVRTAGLLP